MRSFLPWTPRTTRRTRYGRPTAPWVGILMVLIGGATCTWQSMEAFSLPSWTRHVPHCDSSRTPNKNTYTYKSSFLCSYLSIRSQSAAQLLVPGPSCSSRSVFVHVQSSFRRNWNCRSRLSHVRLRCNSSSMQEEHEMQPQDKHKQEEEEEKQGGVEEEEEDEEEEEEEDPYEKERRVLLHEILQLTSTFEQLQESIQVNSLLYKQNIETTVTDWNRMKETLATKELQWEQERAQLLEQVTALQQLKNNSTQFSLERDIQQMQADTNELKKQLQETQLLLLQQEEEFQRQIQDLQKNQQDVLLNSFQEQTQEQDRRYQTIIDERNRLQEKLDRLQKQLDDSVQSYEQKLEEQNWQLKQLLLQPLDFQQQLQKEKSAWEMYHQQQLEQMEEQWVYKYNEFVERSKREHIQLRANSIRERDSENKKVYEEQKSQTEIIHALEDKIHKYEKERNSLRRLLSLSVQRVGSLLRIRPKRNRGEENQIQQNDGKEHDQQVEKAIS